MLLGDALIQCSIFSLLWRQPDDFVLVFKVDLQGAYGSVLQKSWVLIWRNLKRHGGAIYGGSTAGAMIRKLH